MNTILNEILSRRNLRSGVVISPGFSGNTYALLTKAVLLAMEGHSVLVATKTSHPYGGVEGALGRVILDLNLLDSYVSLGLMLDGTLEYSLPHGKIHVCNGKYISRKSYDTLIVLDNVEYASHVLNTECDYYENKIIHLTPMQAVKEPSLCRKIWSLDGKIFDVELAPLPRICGMTGKKLELHVETGETYELHTRGQEFRLRLTGVDPLLAAINPLYSKYLKNLPKEEWRMKACADLTACYHESHAQLDLIHMKVASQLSGIPQ